MRKRRKKPIDPNEGAWAGHYGTLDTGLNRNGNSCSQVDPYAIQGIDPSLNKEPAMTAPIEATIQYATVVEDLNAAWVFVMGLIDQLGPDPTIKINPVWSHQVDETQRRFEVVVSGMVST